MPFQGVLELWKVAKIEGSRKVLGLGAPINIRWPDFRPELSDDVVSLNSAFPVGNFIKNQDPLA